MLYKTCPACGASLDPGEACDCTKEKGLPNANQNSPMRDMVSHIFSIAQNAEKVKTNPLRELRISKEIPAKEIVAEVRKLYPGYDKALQSKCERGEKYGIELRADAMLALLEKYAPESKPSGKTDHRGSDRHRCKCKVTCRLEDAEYTALVRQIEEEGFDTVQAWLSFKIRAYLKSVKKTKSQPKRSKSND